MPGLRLFTNDDGAVACNVYARTDLWENSGRPKPLLIYDGSSLVLYRRRKWKKKDAALTVLLALNILVYYPWMILGGHYWTSGSDADICIWLISSADELAFNHCPYITCNANPEREVNRWQLEAPATNGTHRLPHPPWHTLHFTDSWCIWLVRRLRGCVMTFPPPWRGFGMFQPGPVQS